MKKYKPIRICAKNPISPWYLATTTEAKNLKEAKEKFALANPDYAPSDLIAYYQG